MDVRQVLLADLAATVGFVTQETFLFQTTIEDNLRYGKPDATDDEIVAAAKAAYIHERITQLPDGYATLVGERGFGLSHRRTPAAVHREDAAARTAHPDPGRGDLCAGRG